MTKSTAIWAAMLALSVLFTSAQTGAQKHRPFLINRLYTGPDGQTHAEQVEAKFTAGSTNEVFKLMAVNGAELHRTPPGTVQDWHTAPRRQYVITLSGQGEVELATGKKIQLRPGDIDLAEDLTGKGHITRVVGNEDRVTLTLPVDDQSKRASVLPLPTPSSPGD